MTESQQCVARVWDQSSRFAHSYQCNKKAKEPTQGHWLCAVHRKQALARGVLDIVEENVPRDWGVRGPKSHHVVFEQDEVAVRAAAEREENAERARAAKFDSWEQGKKIRVVRDLAIARLEEHGIDASDLRAYINAHPWDVPGVKE